MRDGPDISSLPPAPPAEPQDDEQSAPIPIVEVSSQIEPPGTTPERSAPRRSEEQEGLPGEKSGEPDESAPRPGEKRPQGKDTAADKKGLPMSANFGIAAEHDHAAQNIGGGAENYMAIDKAKLNNTRRDRWIGKPFLLLRNGLSHLTVVGKSLGNAIYGSVNVVLHPVQTWRNSIAQGAFKNRALLFSADIDHIVRKKNRIY